MFRHIQFKNFDSLEVFHAKNSLQEFPAHYHETFCISLVDKGIFIENNNIATQASLLITNPYEVHTNDILPGLEYSIKTFYVNKEVLKFAFQEKNDFSLSPIIENPKLIQQLNGLARQALSDPKESPLIESFETEFINFLSGLRDYKVTEQKCFYEQPVWTQEIKEYIESKVSEKVSLSTLARLVGMEKFKFIRAFKKNSGLSPFQYLLIIRVLKAKELLQQGYSLAATALEVGFYDQSNFTNYFKYYVGVTPKVYQKSCYTSTMSD